MREKFEEKLREKRREKASDMGAVWDSGGMRMVKCMKKAFIGCLI